jgi:hypothetical protein
MDAMRRLITSLAALGLLGAVLGCNHTAGMCDCDPGCDPCAGYGGGPPLGAVNGHNGWAPGTWGAETAVPGTPVLKPGEPIPAPKNNTNPMPPAPKDEGGL